MSPATLFDKMPMSALSTPPLAGLIARLFAAAEASDAVLAVNRASLIAAADPSGADYRAFYAATKEHYLAVSPATARLLYMLARATRARAIVEFGASFGVSTLHLAAALKDNGGGRLITTEFEPGKAARLRQTLDEAGIADMVELRQGDALETLRYDLPDAIDLVLLDGAKPLYPAILELLRPRFVAGTLIVADNADMCPDYVERVRAADSGYLSLPFGEDVELTMVV
jgi:predicted O-methyltransferase YrrM